MMPLNVYGQVVLAFTIWAVFCLVFVLLASLHNKDGGV